MYRKLGNLRKIMSLRDKIIENQKRAMKERNQDLLDTLRNFWSVIKNEEIEKQHNLSDEEVQSVAKRLVKQLQEASEDFKRGDREDLVEKNLVEISFLKEYLPEQISEEELESIVDQVINENSDKELNMGMLMGIIMQRVKGKADGSIVREMVSNKINKN